MVASSSRLPKWKRIKIRTNGKEKREAPPKPPAAALAFLGIQIGSGYRRKAVGFVKHHRPDGHQQNQRNVGEPPERPKHIGGGGAPHGEPQEIGPPRDDPSRPNLLLNSQHRRCHGHSPFRDVEGRFHPSLKAASLENLAERPVDGLDDPPGHGVSCPDRRACQVVAYRRHLVGAHAPRRTIGKPRRTIGKSCRKIGKSRHPEPRFLGRRTCILFWGFRGKANADSSPQKAVLRMTVVDRAPVSMRAPQTCLEEQRDHGNLTFLSNTGFGQQLKSPQPLGEGSMKRRDFLKTTAAGLGAAYVA